MAHISRLQKVIEELKKEKKSNLSVSWVNRRKQHKQAIVRIAGIAYDGRGRPIVVVRSAQNPKMLFNLPLGNIVSMERVGHKKIKAT